MNAAAAIQTRSVADSSNRVATKVISKTMFMMRSAWLRLNDHVCQRRQRRLRSPFGLWTHFHVNKARRS